MPRIHELGKWGEKKAVALLERAGFSKVQDMNAKKTNQEFCDIRAERDGVRYLISVKTRNRYERNPRRPNTLNSGYKWAKRGIDVDKLMREHDAKLAWIGIAVLPEKQTFSAYFVKRDTISETESHFYIRMTQKHTERYECLTRPIVEFDQSIDINWSNGAYCGN